MGGAEEHRLEDQQSKAQKFGEEEGSGRIPPCCHPRVLQRAAGAPESPELGQKGTRTELELGLCCHPLLALGNVALQVLTL